MSQFLRKFVLPNFGLKLFSLGLAAGLWLVLARDPVAEVALDAPIEFQHMADNLEINSEHVPSAQVRVRGPERLIRSLRTDQIHVEVDLGNARPGERTFNLTAQQVREPRDLKVVQVVPSQFQLSFDVRARREIEVRPRVTGQFASGLRIARVVASPERIAITGPGARVNAIDFATTDPIDASGVTVSQTFITNVYVPDPLIQVVNPVAVHVTVIMERFSGSSGLH
ncbi:MAG: YbbR-like domain-containing protein [Acidobacteria bacterium]|nr:YbbR-like domain-containing protein [Acidobacteriota bacterium]